MRSVAAFGLVIELSLRHIGSYVIAALNNILAFRVIMRRSKLTNRRSITCYPRVRIPAIRICYHATTRSSGHSAVSLSGGGQDLLQCRPQLMQRKCLLNKGRGALVQHLLLNLFCAESTKNYDR